MNSVTPSRHLFPWYGMWSSPLGLAAKGRSSSGPTGLRYSSPMTRVCQYSTPFKLLCSPDCPWPSGHVARVLLAGQLHLLWKSFPFIRARLKYHLPHNASPEFKQDMTRFLPRLQIPTRWYGARDRDPLGCALLSTLSALSEDFKNIYWIDSILYLRPHSLFPNCTMDCMFCFLFSFLILDWLKSNFYYFISPSASLLVLLFLLISWLLSIFRHAFVAWQTMLEC